jgi:conjugative relaxase-like TrwC/TraI family protein
MLFITPTSSAQGAKDYFTRQLAPSDYYVRDAADSPGQWHGLGAELLGLKGEVKKEDFFSLCDNVNPISGEPLTARTKSARRVAYDFTFDAPKSVTLAYELGGDDRILEAFRESVAETMGEMEADVQARVRAGGANDDRRTANMLWAEFVHRTARPVDGVPDPQLHCHAVAFNATFDGAEDRWKAAQFGNLVRDKLYYQAAFHARLAERLQDFGYETLREGNSFALAGIARETSRKFSRRSVQIGAEVDRLGLVNAKAKGELGRLTRQGKGEGQSVAALRAEWLARLSGDERDALHEARSRITGRPDSAQKLALADSALAFAMKHCFERASVLPEKRLVAEALMEGVGRANVGDVWAQAKQADIIQRSHDGQIFATTKEVYREELGIVAFARDGRGQCKKLGGGDTAELDPLLSAEQRAAAQLILNSRDRVIGLRGGAGTGKTRMMQATVKAIEATGSEVFAFAPSAKASRGVLREEGFATADTVERLLTDQEMRTSVHGQVLWIDEAGLLSARDLKRVFDLAREEECRVVLSGDTAQHSAVGRGDALRLLEREAGMPFARLKDIRRQTNEQYREAVREISDGDVPNRDGTSRLSAGLARLDRMGAIVEAEGANRFALLAADYVAATAEQRAGGRPKTALVVSPTHREGEQVASAIRDALKQAGRLYGVERQFLSLKGLGLTEAERGSAANYHGGEVIHFHQNAKGFTRGERVTVRSVTSTSLAVTRADGSAAALPLDEAGKFAVYAAKAVTLAAGDRLRITMNGYTEEVMRAGKPVKSRLNNGDVFVIEGFTRQGDIRLANGFVVPKDYGGITQGYAVTSHASQGATVDKVLIALGSQSLAAANRQQFYVSVSRGREAVRLYTDDKEALKEAVQTDASRMTATELLHGANSRPSKRPDSLGRLIAMQRSRRAYAAVRQYALHAAWFQALGAQEVSYGRH